MPEFGKTPNSVPTFDVEQQIDRADSLPGDRHRRQPGERTKSFEPGRNVGQRVRVQCAGTPIVTRVEGCEQLPHLRAATLSEDQTVRTHTESLAHKAFQPDLPRPFEVSLPGFE